MLKPIKQDKLYQKIVEQIKNLIMVKINGKYIPKEKYKDTIIIDGDDVQVIHSIAGG